MGSAASSVTRPAEGKAFPFHAAEPTCTRKGEHIMDKDKSAQNRPGHSGKARPYARAAAAAYCAVGACGIGLGALLQVVEE